MCNSHYIRNLIAWGLPLALTRQQYNGSVQDARTLSFRPWDTQTIRTRLPFFTPIADGTVTKLESGAYSVHVVEGVLALERMSVAGVGEVGPILLRRGENATVQKAAASH